MNKILPKILRFLVGLFILKKSSYLLGMIFIRIARKMRRKFYDPSKKTEFEIVTNSMGQIKMEVDKYSYMGGSIYWSGYHHVNEIIYLNSILKNDMTFIDIGANQGEFSLFASNKLKNGRVISFEPVSYQFNLLTKNISLNNFKNIEINKYGLSNEVGILPIYNSTNTALHGGFHEGLSTLYKSDERANFQENVDLKIFDEEYFEKLERFDFLKIDIEGAELYALKGMIKSLTKFKPEILIELSDETYLSAGYSVKEMIDFLESLNYKPYRIHRGKLIQTSNNYSQWGNYIFKQ